MDPRDYILDIAGLPDPRANGTGPPRAGEAGPGGLSAGSGEPAGKPWIAIHWKCCRVYSRLYRNRAGTAYEGQCPRCGAPVRAMVGPGGTSQRFFTAE